MGSPVLTATTDKPSYAPGEAITVSWVVTDPDNATEELVLQGTDSQGNAVEARLTITRADPFAMSRVYWVRTGTNLTVDAATRKATGTVPSA